MTEIPDLFQVLKSIFDFPDLFKISRPRGNPAIQMLGTAVISLPNVMENKRDAEVSYCKH